MSKARLFSTKIRFVIMVEPVGGDMLNDCIFLLKAADFKNDFVRALNIGSVHQKEYLNSDGSRVQWKFMEIISIDVIESGDLDGVEIYSEPIHLTGERVIAFGTEFDPKTSKPLQTI